MKNACVLLAMLAIVLAGCSRDEGKQAGQVTVGFSQVGAESEWRTANTASVKSALVAPGFDLKFSDAQQKQENQIKALRSFIAQRVDVIAFSPVVESGWEPVLREAKAAGIPVVLTDRAVKVSDASLYASLIGSDFIEEGRKAGRWLLQDSSGKPGPIRVVELQGTVGSAPAIDRMKGFHEVIDTDPRALGYHQTVWTAPLLVHHLRDHHGVAVSGTTVRRAIARLRLCWKRPRHQLARRPDTWRQSKGGSNAAWTRRNVPSC